jgi:hypothetical protein
MYQQAGSPAPGESQPGPDSTPGNDEDVIEGEFSDS